MRYKSGVPVFISGRLSFDRDDVPRFQSGPNNMSFGQLFRDFEEKIVLVTVAEICGIEAEGHPCTLRPEHEGDHRAVIET